MSEEARPYRHTAGDWGKHPSYESEFKLNSMIRDDGSVYSYCTICISSGSLRIAEVQFSSDGGAGWPQVKNFNEFKANVALISAAPNLLEACIALQAEASARGCGLKIADEAIAKATTY